MRFQLETQKEIEDFYSLQDLADVLINGLLQHAGAQPENLAGGIGYYADIRLSKNLGIVLDNELFDEAERYLIDQHYVRIFPSQKRHAKLYLLNVSKIIRHAYFLKVFQNLDQHLPTQELLDFYNSAHQSFDDDYSVLPVDNLDDIPTIGYIFNWKQVGAFRETEQKLFWDNLTKKTMKND